MSKSSSRAKIDQLNSWLGQIRTDRIGKGKTGEWRKSQMKKKNGKNNLSR